MSNRIPTDDLLDDLHRVVNTIGGTPTISEYRENGDFSPGTLKNRFGSWNNALQTAGYQPNVVNSIDESDLLEDLKRTSDQLDTVPTTAEYNSHGQFSPATLKNRFGSWNEALQEAGFTPNLHKDITKEELLDDIHRVADKIDGSPTIPRYEEKGKYSRKTISSRFGSWNEALKEAGYRLHKYAPRTDLLADIERVYELLGHVPTSKEYDSCGEYSAKLIADRFGSWNAGLESAGYEINQPSRIPCNVLIADLHRVGSSLGEAPTITQYNEMGRYSSNSFYDCFDSWADALIAADFEPNYRQDIPNEKLLANLQQVGDKLNTAPTMDQYQSQGDYSPSTLADSFGSWNEALRAAGYEPNVRSFISREKLIADLQTVGNLIDSSPRMADYEVYGRYGTATISRRFGSWNSALETAGFQPNVRRDISREELITSLHRVSKIINNTPTAEEFREYSNYTVGNVETEFGSWNAGLEAAGLSLHTNIPTDELLSDFSAHHEGSLAPTRQEHSQVGRYHSGTIRSRLDSWWVASVKAGFKPLARRPLCPEAIHQYNHAARNLPDAETSFYALLFQFTGLTPEIAVQFTSDWVADRRNRHIIRVPREFTATGGSWILRIPDTWQNPYTGQEELTKLPGLLDWFTNIYDEIPLEAYTALQYVPLRVAREAGLDEFRRTIDHQVLGAVPEVRPQDLRATLGVNLAREGADCDTISRAIGMEQTGWPATVQDFLIWLDENEDDQHPEYTDSRS